MLQFGTVSHEIGHALGFHHEHSRPDRDPFVEIHPQNILEGHEHNFDVYSFDDVIIDVAYDVGSIMHYGLRVKYFLYK